MANIELRTSVAEQVASDAGERPLGPAEAGEEILTYRDAAQLLKVSPRTVERWTREGRIPYIRLPARGAWSGVRFSRHQLLRWLRTRTVKER